MGITDGSVTCALCGEWMTTCALCKGQERLTDHSRHMRMREKEEREGERELWQQEKAIRDAAEARRRGM